MLFAKPVAASVFLMCNGLILYVGEWHLGAPTARWTAPAATSPVADRSSAAITSWRWPGRPKSKGCRSALFATPLVAFDEDAEHQVAGIGLVNSLWIGASQALALLAGISREGVVMVGGLFRGLSNENALRFAFLLSTPG